MKVLVTGGSGFLGRYIVDFFVASGDELTLLGRKEAAGFKTVVADLAEENLKLPDGGFDLVIHAAGLAHTVPKTDVEARKFVEVNHKGTVHLLSALERAGLPDSVVLISTVAVYGLESGEMIDEGHPLRASEPYGLSKIGSESSLADWEERTGARTAVLRLPLVAGKNPPGNLGAMISAIERGRYMNIGDGSARRSMVLAEDVASFLPKVGAKGGTYNLTDGHHPSFGELSAAIASAAGRKKPLNLPLTLANIGAAAGDIIEKISGVTMPLGSRSVSKMTSSLTFSDEKAKSDLGWSPSRVLDSIDEVIA